jgi:protein-serine/threonine kinase
VPPKNPEKYSAAITERVRHQKMLTGEFFKENVERAKTRNERYGHYIAEMSNSSYAWYTDFPQSARA